eukprot:TRINITY_DN6154_c0_g1_i2.p1 TRINITY_DN6154_c0_g1~~TRINITY_DN6154_c0_g1_i2.p1  ORF type:complete len:476 (-),score=54.73 TRINITY_DN6154_c0_g1_i2:139-1566(-)
MESPTILHNGLRSSSELCINETNDLHQRRDRFMSRIAQQVQSTIELAFKSVGTTRDKVLKDLFQNISSELEDDVLNQLEFASFLESSPNPSNPTSTIYYYQILSIYYKRNPTLVDALHAPFLSLWSNQSFPVIFASLFYLWVFHHQVGHIKYLNMFLRGVNRLFWYDLESVQKRFSTIYDFLRTDILTGEKIWKDAVSVSPVAVPATEPPNNVQNTTLIMLRAGNTVTSTSLGRYVVDFFHLVSRFFYYYEKSTNIPNTLPTFILYIQTRFDDCCVKMGINGRKTCPDETKDTVKIVSLIDTPIENEEGALFVNPLSHSGEDFLEEPSEKLEGENLKASDLFIRATISQIKLIKNENILIRYINCCTYLSSFSMSDPTRVKLQHVLYSYSSPGGPFYPPRSVRHAARWSLDQLFPQGKLGRTTISLLFRLLHPYYSTGSILYYVLTKCKTLFNFFGVSINQDAVFENEAIEYMKI